MMDKVKYREQFAERLLKDIEENNLLYKQVVDKAGICERTLSRMGRGHIPELATLVAIEKAIRKIKYNLQLLDTD